MTFHVIAGLPILAHPTRTQRQPVFQLAGQMLISCLEQLQEKEQVLKRLGVSLMIFDHYYFQ